MNIIPVIDMHCDTISEILKARLHGRNISLRENDLSLDLMRMKSAGYMCQNFALFTMMGHWMSDAAGQKADPVRELYPTPFDCVIAMSDIYDNEIQLNSDIIRPAFSGTEIKAYADMGFMAALKTVEEGAVYEGKVENLERLYDHGVRMTTLTWNFENELAFPNAIDMQTGKASADTVNGLKAAGRDIVKACSELGVIVDVSHLGDAGILEVLDILPPDVPIVASHSNARSVAGHPRNVTDEMLRKIADRGGVCGLNYCSEFANGVDGSMTMADDLVQHIRHMADVGGMECIGLGSDYDGINNEVETGGCEGMQLMAERIAAAGIPEEDVEKIFYKNVLRLYSDVLG